MRIQSPTESFGSQSTNSGRPAARAREGPQTGRGVRWVPILPHAEAAERPAARRVAWRGLGKTRGKFVEQV